MPIQPLQIPSYVAPQTLDSSSLANLGKVYQQAQTENLRKQTLANLGTGDWDYNTATKQLVQAGDLEGALSLANIGKSVNSSNNVYGTPIYGTTPDGKTAIGTFDHQGKFRSIDTGGFQPTPGIRTIDTGTGTVVVSGKSGQPIGGGAGQPGQSGTPGYYGKDVTGKAAGEKYGAEIGEKAAGMGQAKSALNSSINSLDRMAFEADRIGKDKNLGRITGLWGMLPNIPGGGAANVNAKLETLKSQVAFGVLQAMREASKTGGALGSVSDRENAMLTSALAALDRAQSEGEFRNAMRQIVDYTKGAKERLQQAYDTDYASVRRPSEQSPSPGVPKGGTTAQPTSEAEFNALPSGTTFVAPDGSTRIKP